MPLPSSPVRLRAATLSLLDPRVAVPSYDRTALRPAIVHIGVGGFHRAHQAVYLDRLLHLADTPRWGICGLGVLPSDERLRSALRGQDFLYTVMERSAEGTQARVVGSLIDFVLAPEDPAAALARLESPETRIVSLTVTEGGYFTDEGTGQFDPRNAALQHDLHDPAHPKTWMGYVLEALDRRRARGRGGFTLMSCDNLQGNGHVARDNLLAYAALRDPGLAAWVQENVSFPNSMVDRITPGTTPGDIDALREGFGVEDAWPVVTEPFLQWVIEDQFSQGRPPWERVGAEMVHDVLPYELMKMRLLNGSHMAMAYLGALLGYRFVHEAMQDPRMTRFIAAFMEEVTPVVPAIPGTSLPLYKGTLMQRFANPTINDQITRICSEGASKIPKFVLPTIEGLLARHLPVKLTSFVIATWIRYFQAGVDARGQKYQIVEARADELCRAATEAGPDPAAFLALPSLFGGELAANSVFREGVRQSLADLRELGTAGAIERVLLL